MNIIVTGGSGFIGKSLIPKLLSLGYKVFVIDISSDSIEVYPWFKKINFYKLRIDSSDIETVSSVPELTISCGSATVCLTLVLLF